MLSFLSTLHNSPPLKCRLCLMILSYQVECRRRENVWCSNLRHKWLHVFLLILFLGCQLPCQEGTQVGLWNSTETSIQFKILSKVLTTQTNTHMDYYLGSNSPALVKFQITTSLAKQKRFWVEITQPGHSWILDSQTMCEKIKFLVLSWEN